MQNYRLFIGNIPENTTEQELSNEFSAYGNIKGAEIKSKDDNTFGFINLETEDRFVVQCIREFSEQKFKGVFLKVARAKESFLDKLKREREDAERRSNKTNISQGNQGSESYTRDKNNVPSLPSFKATETVESSSSSESESEDEEPVQKPVPRVIPKPVARNEDEFVKKWNCEGYVENGLLKIIPITGEVKEVIETHRGKKQIKPLLNAADQKRLKGLENIKSSYDSQKRLIQSALSASLDGANSKKIRFDVNDEEEGDSKKLTLFDDDENDEDLTGYKRDFAVKKQFQGTKGEELFNLQSKFKNDSRFIMDSKFTEEDGMPGNKKKKQQEKKKKPTPVEKEIELQLKLLQEMDMSKNQSTRDKFQNQKTMVRFDPTKQEHSKYTGNPMDVATMKMDSQVKKETEVYQVSDEQFTKVSKNLKQALETGSSGFSLLQMFGKSEDIEKVSGQVDEYHTTDAKFSGKRFQYDSSDESDTEVQPDPKKIKTSMPSSTISGIKSGKYTKMGIFQENFFYSADDDRLKEGLKFFIQVGENKNRENPETSTSELKKIVKLKTKRQNVMKSSREMYAKSFKKTFTKKTFRPNNETFPRQTRTNARPFNRKGNKFNSKS